MSQFERESEIQPQEPQAEVQERTPEDLTRSELALLTLLHARLERGSDVESLYPAPPGPGLRA